MPIRTIKVYGCSNCGVETVAKGEKTKGWIYGGAEENRTAECSRGASVLGEQGHNPGFQEDRGIWCSITCYVQHVKERLTDLGANQYPLAEEDEVE